MRDKISNRLGHGPHAAASPPVLSMRPDQSPMAQGRKPRTRVTPGHAGQVSPKPALTRARAPRRTLAASHLEDSAAPPEHSLAATPGIVKRKKIWDSTGTFLVISTIVAIRCRKIRQDREEPTTATVPARRARGFSRSGSMHIKHGRPVLLTWSGSIAPHR